MKRKTHAEAAIERLTEHERLVLQRNYDLPSLEADPEGFKKELGKKMYQWTFRKDRLTPEEVVRMLLAQDEKCYICRRSRSHLKVVKNEQWHIDHDHASPPKIRGILCSTCNRWLGYLEKNHSGDLLGALKRTAKYVYEPPAQKAGIDRIVTFDPNRPPIALSDTQLGNARHLYSQGFPDKEIASNLNVRTATIARYRRKGYLTQESV